MTEEQKPVLDHGPWGETSDIDWSGYVEEMFGELRSLSLPLPDMVQGTVRLRRGIGFFHIPSLAITEFVPESMQSSLSVILVHGGYHSQFCWSWVAAWLCNAGLRVITLDLPGHGLSSGWDEKGIPQDRPVYQRDFAAQVEVVRGYTLDDYARAVGYAIHEMGLDPAQVVVVGHSMSGGVVQLVAQDVTVAGVVVLGMSNRRYASVQLPGMLWNRHVFTMVDAARHSNKLLSEKFISYYFLSHCGSSGLVGWLRGHLQAESQHFSQAPQHDTKTYQRSHEGNDAEFLGRPPVRYIRGELDHLALPSALEMSVRRSAVSSMTTLPGLPHDAMVPVDSRPDGWQMLAEEIGTFTSVLGVPHSQVLMRDRHAG